MHLEKMPIKLRKSLPQKKKKKKKKKWKFEDKKFYFFLSLCSET